MSTSEPDDPATYADVAVAAAAVHTLGTLPTDRWPMVAAHLLSFGYEGQNLLALACLSESATGWEIDPLLPGALEDIGAPQLSVDQAAEILAVLLVHGTPVGDHAIVRTLARFAPDLGYPEGIITRAYLAEEFLDCECHPDGRHDAVDLEAEFRAKPPLRIPNALMAALIG